MAAQIVTKLPEGNDWVYEVKWDGYRALVLKDGNQVQLRSRNDKDFTLKYPPIVDAALRLKAEQVTLDGEIVALGEMGAPRSRRYNIARRPGIESCSTYLMSCT